jgi:AraC family transcriptional regulator
MSTQFREPASPVIRRYAWDEMSKLLGKPVPLADWVLRCGTRLTRRWVREGYEGYARGMTGHLIATCHSGYQDCYWRLENTVHTARLRPGTLTVIPQSHDGQWTLAGPMDVSHVYLSEERLRACADMVAKGKQVELLPRLGVEDAAAAQLLEILSREAVLSDRSSLLFADRAVDLLCLQLLRMHSAFGSMPLAPPRRGLATWQVRRVTQYMRENMDQAVGLDELAALVHLSRFHFCTAFRLATGQTPHEWLTAERIRRAKDLLTDPALRITEIALMVGYKTSSAFSASFRKIAGVAPSEFRRRL